MNTNYYRDRMLARINAVDSRLQTDLGDTFSTFTATRDLRTDILDQAADAKAWAAQLEGGTETEETHAELLSDYAASLDAATNENSPAPHYQAIRAGLEQKLQPDQYEQVLNDPRIQLAADASMENALYSGKEILESGTGEDHPYIYRDHKLTWDQASALAVIDGEPVEISPSSPIRGAVNDVLTDEQRITQDQRRIDSAMLAGQPQLADSLGVGAIERAAMNTYGTPMIDDGPLANTAAHTSPANQLPALDAARAKDHGPDLT